MYLACMNTMPGIHAWRGRQGTRVGLSDIDVNNTHMHKKITGRLLAIQPLFLSLMNTNSRYSINDLKSQIQRIKATMAHCLHLLCSGPGRFWSPGCWSWLPALPNGQFRITSNMLVIHHTKQLSHRITRITNYVSVMVHTFVSASRGLAYKKH